NEVRDGLFKLQIILKKSAGIGCAMIACFLLWLRPGTGSAQTPELPVQVFDYSVGIRPGSIVSLVKDDNGFLWILYSRSVQRFDGRQVRTYRIAPGLLDVMCDGSSRIWVRSFQGAWCYDPVIDNFVNRAFAGL